MEYKFKVGDKVRIKDSCLPITDNWLGEGGRLTHQGPYIIDEISNSCIMKLSGIEVCLSFIGDRFELVEEAPKRISCYIKYSPEFTEDLFNKTLEWCKNNIPIDQIRGHDDTYSGLIRNKMFLIDNWGWYNKNYNPRDKDCYTYGVDNNRQGCKEEITVQQLKELIGYEDIPQFEVGKWYKNLGSNGDYIAPFTAIEKNSWVNNSRKDHIYRGKYRTGTEKYLTENFKNAVEISLEEIQQYLPEGHPDKFNTVKAKYKCLPFPKNKAYFTARVIKDITRENIGTKGDLPNIIPKGSITWLDYNSWYGSIIKKFDYVCPENNRYYANIPADYFEVIEVFNLEQETMEDDIKVGDWCEIVTLDSKSEGKMHGKIGHQFQIDKISSDGLYYATSETYILGSCWPRNCIKKIECPTSISDKPNSFKFNIGDEVEIISKGWQYCDPKSQHAFGVVNNEGHEGTKTRITDRCFNIYSNINWYKTPYCENWFSECGLKLVKEEYQCSPKPESAKYVKLIPIDFGIKIHDEFFTEGHTVLKSSEELAFEKPNLIKKKKSKKKYLTLLD